MDSRPAYVRTRLSVMMFLEFFVYGCWGVAIAGYGQTLGFSGSQIGWLIAVGAIGAIISPLFVGLIADRYFAAQRMLSVLHFLGAVCLIAAGFQTSFLPLVTLMLLNGLAFMPTMGKPTAYNVTVSNGPGAGLYCEFLPYTQETGGFEHLGLWVCQDNPWRVAPHLQEYLADS